MGLWLAFAPFIVFSLGDHFVGVTAGLIAAAVVAAGLLLRDVLIARKAPKVIEIGTTLLFGGLALYAWLGAPAWSIVGVRLRVDGGLLFIVLVSIAIGRPFTLQYALEQVAQEHWQSAEFRKTNYVLSAAWALAFLLLVIADLILLHDPGLPRRVGIMITIVALLGAYKFTDWYPERGRKKPVA